MNSGLKETGTELLNQLKHVVPNEYGDLTRVYGLPEQHLLLQNIARSAYFFDLFQNLHGLLKFHVNDEVEWSADAAVDWVKPLSEGEFEGAAELIGLIEKENYKKGDQEHLRDFRSEDESEAPFLSNSSKPTDQPEQADAIDLQRENVSGNNLHGQAGSAKSESSIKNDDSGKEAEIEDLYKNQRKQDAKVSLTKDFNEMAALLSSHFDEDAEVNLQEVPHDFDKEETKKVRSNHDMPTTPGESSSQNVERVRTFDNLLEDHSKSKDSVTENANLTAISGAENTGPSLKIGRPSLKEPEQSENQIGRSIVPPKNEAEFSDLRLLLNALLQQILRKAGKEEAVELLQVIQNLIETGEEAQHEMSNDDMAYWMSSSAENSGEFKPVYKTTEALMRRSERLVSPVDERYRTSPSVNNVDFINEGSISEPMVPPLSAPVRYAKRDNASPTTLEYLRSQYRRFYGE